MRMIQLIYTWLNEKYQTVQQEIHLQNESMFHCHVTFKLYVFNNTVDGKNPANQLRLVVYPTIFRVILIPGGWPDL